MDELKERLKTHYGRTESSARMSWQSLYSDFLDQCDEHAKRLEDRALGFETTVEPWDVFSEGLTARLRTREQSYEVVHDEIEAAVAAEFERRAAERGPGKATPSATPEGGGDSGCETEQQRAEKTARNRERRERKKAKREERKAPGGSPKKGNPGVCFEFRDRNFSRGNKYRFSHDLAADGGNGGGAQPKVRGAWDGLVEQRKQRKDPQRGEPTLPVPAHTMISGDWIKLRDR